MFLVISKKISRVHGNPQPVTLDNVRAAVNGNGANISTAATQSEVDAIVNRNTAMGLTCHVFNYAESFQSVSSIQTIKAVA